MEITKTTLIKEATKKTEKATFNVKYIFVDGKVNQIDADVMVSRMEKQPDGKNIMVTGSVGNCRYNNNGVNCYFINTEFGELGVEFQTIIEEIKKEEK